MASYEQNEQNKKWSVRFRVILGGQEVNKRLSGFRTKKEAQAGYINFINEYEKEKKLLKGTLEKSTEDMPFKELIGAYLSHLKTRNKYSSWYSTQNKISKNISPYFDNLKIKDITPLVVLQWQQSIDSMSFSYKRGLRGLLNSIFKFGERYYDIRNVVAKVEPFRNLEAKKEMLFWTVDEFHKFIDCVEQTEYKLFFKVLFITGARKGEILALSWNDIDLHKNTINISKSMTRKADGKAYGITTPKNTSSNRKIDMPLNLTNELKAYKKWQKENYTNTDFVFCGERPFPETTTTRIFDKACADAEVKKIRLHDFRHSCASLLISEGVSIVAVSKRLGHKNIEQTLNTYSHMMPNDVSLMIKALEKI